MSEQKIRYPNDARLLDEARGFTEATPDRLGGNAPKAAWPKAAYRAAIVSVPKVITCITANNAGVTAGRRAWRAASSCNAVAMAAA